MNQGRTDKELEARIAQLEQELETVTNELRETDSLLCDTQQDLQACRETLESILGQAQQTLADTKGSL